MGGIEKDLYLKNHEEEVIVINIIKIYLKREGICKN